jgi:hypothetical protein
MVPVYIYEALLKAAGELGDPPPGRLDDDVAAAVAGAALPAVVAGELSAAQRYGLYDAARAPAG